MTLQIGKLQLEVSFNFYPKQAFDFFLLSEFILDNSKRLQFFVFIFLVSNVPCKPYAPGFGLNFIGSGLVISATGCPRNYRKSVLYFKFLL